MDLRLNWRLLSIILLVVLSCTLLLLYQIKKAWEVADLGGIINSIQEQVLLIQSVWLKSVCRGVLNLLDFTKYFWDDCKISRLWYVYYNRRLKLNGCICRALCLILNLLRLILNLNWLIVLSYLHRNILNCLILLCILKHIIIGQRNDSKINRAEIIQILVQNLDNAGKDFLSILVCLCGRSQSCSGIILW